MTAASIESVAVVICTHNRAASLRKTLESLAACVSPPSVRWDVWVVDNASSDATGAVVAEFLNRLTLHYVREERAGLSCARNRAIDETGDSHLLLFTDDDVRMDAHWVEAFVRAARENPDASFFGGRVRPMFPRGRPPWLSDERMDLLDGLLVSYDRGETVRKLGDGEILPVGASMGFRAECFSNGERFREDLGVCGEDLRRGEDTEFLGRLRDRGRVGVYVGNAVSDHEVAPHRLTWSYAFRYGMACEGGRGSLATAAAYIGRGVRQWAMGRGDRARQCVIRAGMEIRACKR